MKLYFSKGACSLTIRIIIHEAGDLKAKTTASGENFLMINPKGSVPTIVTDNNDVITENTAIMQYIAETYHATSLLPAIGDIKRYRVLEWLSYLCSDFHKGFGPLFNPKVTAEMKNEVFIPNLKAKLDFLESNLHQKKYLMGDTFTLPDAYLFVMLRWLVIFNIDIGSWSNLSHFSKEVSRRKSVEEAMMEEQLKEVGA